MKFKKPSTLKEISEMIGARMIGNPDFPVNGINEIHIVEEGDITFVDHPKYYEKALKSKATIIIINKEVECPEGKSLLISDDPFKSFVSISKKFRPFETCSKSISDTAEIGDGTVIQPNSFVGNYVKIGKNCIIHSNVSIYDHCIIGDNVIIEPNTIIASNSCSRSEFLVAPNPAFSLPQFCTSTCPSPLNE